MTPNTKHLKGLPPQYPGRRCSNNSISNQQDPSTINHHNPKHLHHPNQQQQQQQQPQQTPNRSRSLDGLLDDQTAAEREDFIPSENVTKSCDDLEDKTKPMMMMMTKKKKRVEEDCFDDDEVIIDGEEQAKKSASLESNVDKVSMLSASSGSDTKRKRNFMDRCVNKVRSLIKK